MGTRRALAALTIGAVLLASCGGSSSDGSSALPTIELEDTSAVLAASVNRTNDIGSYHFDMIAEVTIEGFDEAVTMRADGAVNVSSGEARMTIDLADMFQSFADQPGADMLAELMGDGEMSMIITPSAAYMKFAALTEIMGSTEWVEIPIDMATSQASDFGFALGDPTQLLGDLDSEGAVSDLGPDTVQGIAAHRYRVVFDPSEFADAGSGDLFSSEIPLDFWIDDSGLLRRVEGSYDVVGTSAAFAIELHSFGEDAAIDVPSGDDVTTFDMSAFLG